MKFTCERTCLIQALAITARALPSKPSTPILAGISIKADNDTVEMCATDNETTIVTKVTTQDGLDIIESGTAIFVGRYFVEMMRNMPGDTITIEYDQNNNNAQIKSGKLKYTISPINGEFPTTEAVNSNLEITVSDKALRNLINRTQYACSTDPVRPIFTGCALQINGNSLTMAATNTHQLAVQTVKLDTEYEQNITVTIPSKILGNIEKMLVSEVPSDVIIKLDNKRAAFDYENGKIKVTTRLIEGKFPDYRRVIPLDFKTRVTINTSEFAMALRRIGVISNTSEHKSCKFEFSNQSIRISSNNPDIGYSEEIIPAIVDGNDLTISFNSDYLSKVISVINGENFIFSLNTNLSAAAIREIDTSDFTYIITPIRTVN